MTACYSYLFLSTFIPISYDTAARTHNIGNMVRSESAEEAVTYDPPTLGNRHMPPYT